MIKGIESILIASSDPQALAKFYEEKVGFKEAEEYELGEGDSVFNFTFDTGPALMIVSHSKVKGRNQDSHRFEINFEVEDIDEAVEKVKGNSVKVIQEKYHIEGYGYLATFEDLDGNYFQLAQIKG